MSIYNIWLIWDLCWSLTTKSKLIFIFIRVIRLLDLRLPWITNYYLLLNLSITWHNRNDAFEFSSESLSNSSSETPTNNMTAEAIRLSHWHRFITGNPTKSCNFFNCFSRLWAWWRNFLNNLMNPLGKFSFLSSWSVVMQYLRRHREKL